MPSLVGLQPAIRNVAARAAQWTRGQALALAVVAAAMLLAACGGPTYPNCASDDHCKSKGEYCVNTKCAQCRIDSHCPGADSDKCVSCQAGACGRKPDCCSSNLDCGAGKKCDVAANKCVAQCAADTDCASGQKCVGGACTSPSVTAGADGCKSDGDCGGGLKCKDGRCTDEKGNCALATINFAFNEYNLTESAQNGLSANLKCLKEKPVVAVTVEGHCDERGTDAYNMELGTKRAKAVKDFLQAALPKVKVKTLSFGKTKPLCSTEDESCWGRNRRAEFRTQEK
ncbi:MAG: OmpA family protein [Deltaproteobacteria bacterium]|nr:OmpA family protein [Deltaproteobacteria bacterium]